MRSPLMKVFNAAPVVLLLSLSAALGMVPNEDCTGPFENRRPEPTDLREREVVKKKRELAQQNFCKIDLSGMTLSSPDFEGAYMSFSNLSGADLLTPDFERAVLWTANFENIKLDGGIFDRAQLDRASFRASNIYLVSFSDVLARDVDFSESVMSKLEFERAALSESIFEMSKVQKSKFTKADLIRTNWKGSVLVDVDFSDADLRQADFSGAKLYNVNFLGANLQGLNLGASTFDPVPGTLPKREVLESFQIDENMKFDSRVGSPHGLIAIRDAKKEAGRVTEERQLTYAIESERTRRLFDGTITDRIEASFRTFFFDFTTAYGMRPGRAIILLFALIPVFAVIYLFAIIAGKSPGIWRIWNKDAIILPSLENLKEPILLKSWRGIFPAFQFSVASAFRIGWHELTVGSWLTALQLNDYSLAGTGWLRTVSGLQSLISVYLLAISLLTYFGRPFN